MKPIVAKTLNPQDIMILLVIDVYSKDSKSRLLGIPKLIGFFMSLVNRKTIAGIHMKDVKSVTDKIAFPKLIILILFFQICLKSTRNHTNMNKKTKILLRTCEKIIKVTPIVNSIHLSFFINSENPKITSGM
ncbi:hypothetical protein GCM10019996_20800 [Lentilactobacillus parakefiri]